MTTNKLSEESLKSEQDKNDKTITAIDIPQCDKVLGRKMQVLQNNELTKDSKIILKVT